ncbi:MAG: hypothetical protein AUJ82_05680 [Verrucomicrobia bacterium CG1_02_43_26]|nr:MAG: hypothetical protein AUJ82_05680 [Verrucomicrobia bacterium CG1_02_43_26]
MAEKILLLDKYPTHAETLRSQLEAEGFRVQFETEVEPLFGDLGACDYLIIFADEALQGKAAVEMLKNVKTVNASLPVVMVASHWNIQDMVQIANTGISLLMEKPFNLDVFLDLIGHLRQTSDEENRGSGAEEGVSAKDRIDGNIFDNALSNEELAYLPSFRGWQSGWVSQLQKKVAEDNSIFLALHKGAEKELIIRQIGVWRGLDTTKVKWISASDLSAAGDKDFIEKVTSHEEKSPIVVIDNLLNVQQDVHYYALNSLKEGPYDLDDGQPILFVYLLDEASVKSLEDDFKHELAVYIKMNLVEVLPLHERLTDLALYAFRFAKEFAKEAKAPERGQFTPEAISALLNYDWPRNYSELKEVIGMAVKAAKEGPVTAEQLTNYIKLKNGITDLQSMKDYLIGRQKEHVNRYLKQNSLAEKDFLESLGFGSDQTVNNDLFYPELLDISKY